MIVDEAKVMRISRQASPYRLWSIEN